MSGGVIDRVIYAPPSPSPVDAKTGTMPSSPIDTKAGAVLSPLDLFGPGVRLTSALLSPSSSPSSSSPSPPLAPEEDGSDVAVVVLKPHVFQADGKEIILHAVLDRARQAGLTIAGARIVYPPQPTEHQVSVAIVS